MPNGLKTTRIDTSSNNTTNNGTELVNTFNGLQIDDANETKRGKAD